MIFFNSSAIHAASYNESTATLTLWFQQGKQGYDHYSVPNAIFQGLVQAQSPGRYYNDNIRDRYGR